MVITPFLFILGISIGSFLDVIISRIFLDASPKLPKDIISSRSACASCKHALGFWDLIPLLSFLFLRGRCRYCGAKIPFRCFLMELLTGILFAFYGIFVLKGVFPFDFQSWMLILYSLIVISSLIVIFQVDLHKYIIPNQIIFSLIGLGLILEPIWGLQGLKHQVIQLNQFLFDVYWLIKSVVQNFGIELSLSYSQLPIIPAFLNPIISAFLMGLFFYLIVFLTRFKGMGMGDVKLAFFMGLFLGWPGSIIALYLAFVSGAIVSLIMIFLKKKKLKQKIPFGPFLIFGFFCTWFWNAEIISIFARIVH